MNVLVTGAGGFLGRHIAKQLVDRGDRVRAFSRGQYPELDALGIETIQGDIQDASALSNACQDIDTVFHTAGVAGIWGPWKYFHGINTIGTKHVVAACQQNQVSRLVFTSSPSVTFNGTDQSGIDESSEYPTRWLCHYPHSKALAEQHVLASNAKHGLSTCALRPHLIWGPGDQHLIPRLLDRARAGKLVQVGAGRNMIDTIYVENAATAHLQAADALTPDSPLAGRAYFISQGEPVNCWDWINDLLALAGLKRVKKSISFGMAWRLGAVLEAAYYLMRKNSEPRMTRFLAAQLAMDHYFNMNAAREHFGYSPQVSTEEGMRRLEQALKDALGGGA